MSKKQVIGTIVAGLVFVFVCVSSVMTKLVSEKYVKDTSESMMGMGALLGDNTGISLPVTPYVGVVKVEGTIMDTSEQSSSLFQTVGYDHQKTMDYIQQMIEDETNNKGILLYVNSPGGTVYHSDELYLKLKEYKDTGRPVWTYMAQQACSGGYYISMASDKIIANRNCWTGSIGVITSLTNLSGLYKKLGIKEENIVSGPNKAMGSAGTPITKEHREILQSMVDEAYGQFLGIVAKGRKISEDKLRPIADGRIYTAKQALDVGLIDKIGEYEATKDDFMETIEGDVTMYEPEEGPMDIFSSLFSMYKNAAPQSDAEVIQELIEKEGNGVPMYYAEPRK